MRRPRARPEAAGGCTRAMGSSDRRARGVAVEVVDAQVVVEQVRDAPLEAVELRERVLAQRDEEVHAQVGSLTIARTRRRTCPARRSSRVVEEVLLELVEDDEQRRARAGVQRGQRLARAACRVPTASTGSPGAPPRPRPRRRSVSRASGRVAPGREDARPRTRTALGRPVVPRRSRAGGGRSRRRARRPARRPRAAPSSCRRRWRRRAASAATRAGSRAMIRARARGRRRTRRRCSA